MVDELEFLLEHLRHLLDEAVLRHLAEHGHQLVAVGVRVRVVVVEGVDEAVEVGEDGGDDRAVQRLLVRSLVPAQGRHRFLPLLLHPDQLRDSLEPLLVPSSFDPAGHVGLEQRLDVARALGQIETVLGEEVDEVPHELVQPEHLVRQALGGDALVLLVLVAAQEELQADPCRSVVLLHREALEVELELPLHLGMDGHVGLHLLDHREQHVL
mmetsp:Transcript_22174/g.43125  ORF Transcript_22174/g.43125 Transcript_22174/m.43125 type:complete len:212 (-) Transcript_22174:3044-3679(-)